MSEVEARLDVVAAVRAADHITVEHTEQLAQILDIERLLAKVTIGTANPRSCMDWVVLKIIPAVKWLLQNVQAQRLQQSVTRLDEMTFGTRF